MQSLTDQISAALAGIQVPDGERQLLATFVSVALSLLGAWIIYQVLIQLVGRNVKRLVRHTSVTWDDILFNDKVLRSVWRFLFTVVLYMALPSAFSYYPSVQPAVVGLCKILTVLGGMMIAVRFISASHDLVLDTDRFKSHSLKGIFQMIQLVVILISVIIIISILINKDPLAILTGLGAAAAILVLAFQDTILGLVAGIQLSANDMLRPGDWISSPKYNANGYVLEVTLTTVKVQNFDKTIVTLPPTALIRESFQNWRGMLDSGGRRVMRSVNIDMTTVRHVDRSIFERFEGTGWPTDEVRESLGPRFVNLTLFRRYLEWSVASEPTLCADMTTLVRELQPTPEGIPVEVYFFTSRTDWPGYEQVQADFFDRLLAAVTMFDLRVFQRPTGHDVRKSMRNA